MNRYTAHGSLTQQPSNIPEAARSSSRRHCGCSSRVTSEALHSADRANLDRHFCLLSPKGSSARSAEGWRQRCESCGQARPRRRATESGSRTRGCPSRVISDVPRSRRSPRGFFAPLHDAVAGDGRPARPLCRGPKLESADARLSIRITSKVLRSADRRQPGSSSFPSSSRKDHLRARGRAAVHHESSATYGAAWILCSSSTFIDRASTHGPRTRGAAS